jgi:hypothetical protein
MISPNCTPAERFRGYVAEIASVIGHADRVGPLADYCTGLMLPGDRKSVEPMAARTAPARVAAQHQSLLHFVGVGPWSDEKVRSLSHVRPAGNYVRATRGGKTTGSFCRARNSSWSAAPRGSRGHRLWRPPVF